MQAYRTNLTVSEHGNLILKGLPFQKGDDVEVIVLRREEATGNPERYPLRGMSIRYDEPFMSVAEDDWNAIQ